jgi:hypothetical protein
MTCQFCLSARYLQGGLRGPHDIQCDIHFPVVSCDTQMASFGLRCLRPPWPSRPSAVNHWTADSRSLTRTRTVAPGQDAINGHAHHLGHGFLLTCFVTCGQLGCTGGANGPKALLDTSQPLDYMQVD